MKCFLNKPLLDFQPLIPIKLGNFFIMVNDSKTEMFEQYARNKIQMFLYSC